MNPEHKEKIEKARLKYKPENIKCLFIAEAPPDNEDRFFYFEDVREQDSLYMELMKVLFKPPKSGENLYEELFGGKKIPVHTLRNEKVAYLEMFKEKGFFLIDALDYPMPSHISKTNEKIKYLSNQKDALANKVRSLKNPNVPIVLISVPVYSAMAGTLNYYNFRVLNESPIEFPGSGQQEKFRQKMEDLIEKHRAIFGNTK